MERLHERGDMRTTAAGTTRGNCVHLPPSHCAALALQPASFPHLLCRLASPNHWHHLAWSPPPPLTPTPSAADDEHEGGPPHVGMVDLSTGERQMRGCALARDLNVVQSRVKRQRRAGTDGWPAEEGDASPQPAPHVPLMQPTSAAASAAAAVASSASAAPVRMATVSQGGVVVPGRIVGSGFCTTGGAIDQRDAATLTPNPHDSWR